MTLLAGARRTAAQGGEGLELRLLSAWEVLEARREAEELARGEREKALCANACLLARALEKDGKAAFPSGEAVLEALTVETIAALSRQWAEFKRRENPSPREEGAVEEAKKAWSTRPIPASSGACSKPSGPCPPRSGPNA